MNWQSSCAASRWGRSVRADFHARCRNGDCDESRCQRCAPLPSLAGHRRCFSGKSGFCGGICRNARCRACLARVAYRLSGQRQWHYRRAAAGLGAWPCRLGRVAGWCLMRAGNSSAWRCRVGPAKAATVWFRLRNSEKRLVPPSRPYRRRQEYQQPLQAPDRSSLLTRFTRRA